MQQTLGDSIRKHVSSGDLLQHLVSWMRGRPEPDVAELLDLIQPWRDSARHQEAARTPAYLEVMGCETVLRTLSRIRMRAAYGETRAAARGCLEALADARGLTREQLEDRIVPTCGLAGEILFDYGPRQFTLVLGNGHRPLLRDRHGRHRTGRPRPRRGDDRAAVQATWERWRAAKRVLGAESELQTRRFEQAMLTGRRWSAADFTRDILGHPLLAELARRLIWGGYDAEGRLRAAFCLADQLSPTDEDYAPLRLEEYAALGLPHPIEVVPARRLRWFELLSDFHVVPLFPQAARLVAEPSEAERAGERITRFATVLLDSQRAQNGLVQRGWEMAYRAGQHCVVRFFEQAALTVVLTLDWPVYNVLQIASYSVVAGAVPGSSSPDPLPPPVPLVDVPPLVLSETLASLIELTSDPAMLPQP